MFKSEMESGKMWCSTVGLKKIEINKTNENCSVTLIVSSAEKCTVHYSKIKQQK